MTKSTVDHQPTFEQLRILLGERFSTGESVRAQHGRDESWHHPGLPDAVCFPGSTDEVAAIVKVCAAGALPIIPFGAGTSIEGQLIPTGPCLSMNLSGLDRILAINSADLDVTVEAGVTRNQLNEQLKREGLFFPIDPGADASIGGMASTRASGTNAVRYGTMRENVLALRAVLPDGRVVRTSRRARKSSAGYDLTRLFIGAEGTLGVITEVTLRLFGIPEAVSAAVVSFESMEPAINAVIETIQVGIPVARIELLDAVLIDAVNRFSKLDNPVKPTLFLEFHGTPAGVEEQARQFGEIAAEHGGASFRWTTKPEERSRLWTARHDAFYAALALRPGCKGWATDVCVPISRLAECILETERDLKSSALIAPLVGHVGDGNFHLVMLIDPDDEDELQQAQRLNDRLVERALAMDGTCTGEHGVGIGKKKYLIAEHGAEAVDTMRAIKQALDPDNIMNPGKILP